ncbi:MAG: DUF3822 family protein [Phaeodactylibacter sp.]|nr:DUF3822 family protein [Phaeodactylibacter sp.]MCB9304098.1 DUF3822 family protein [Lewinellaceae bacterium]HQU59422.1 DUF3822 family protein [Saprospiraceae bacterium]
MIIKDITEDTLVKKYTNTYELSILIGVDSFDYMVLDGQQQVLALKTFGLQNETGSHLAAVEAAFQAEKFLHQPFRNIRVGFVSGRNTLLPQRLYDENENEAYLRQITELLPGEAARADALPVLSLYNVYAAALDEITLARRLFPGCRIFHITTALLEGLRHLAVQQERRSIFAHLKDGMLFVVLFEGKELLFANAFPYQAAKDFIYFILLVFQQFGLQPESQTLHLSGQLLPDSEIYREALRYIRNLEFVPAPAFFKFGPRISQEPHYLYFGLLSLSLCT